MADSIARRIRKANPGLNPNLHKEQFREKREEIYAQQRDFHATLKPMKTTLKSNGISYPQALRWARQDPKTNGMPNHRVASMLAEMHDQDPEGFIKKVQSQ
jgi:hypothetical protein